MPNRGPYRKWAIISEDFDKPRSTVFSQRRAVQNLDTNNFNQIVSNRNDQLQRPFIPHEMDVNDDDNHEQVPEEIADNLPDDSAEGEVDDIYQELEAIQNDDLVNT